MKTVLDCVYGLLLYPETDDPIDSGLAMQFFNDHAGYEVGISDHVAKHAKTKTLAQWKDELLEDEDVDESQLCSICAGSKICVVFIPCGHMCTCENCSTKIEVCPICRKGISKKQIVHAV